MKTVMVVLAVAGVWAILFLVPFVVYGLASRLILMKLPGGNPGRFLLAVAVSKVGTAIAFVTIFYLCRNVLRDQWLLYAVIWFSSFAISEIGDTIKPEYSVVEAFLGIVSEAIYTPAAALLTARLLR